MRTTAQWTFQTYAQQSHGLFALAKHLYICCFSISIRSWDITTFAFRKQTDAMWKFYCRFRFWTFYRHLHVSLHRRNKFIWRSLKKLWRYVNFSRRRPYRRKYSFAFLFYDISPLGTKRTLCVSNFDQISQSTAKILLLPVAENKRPRYSNSTSNFVHCV